MPYTPPAGNAANLTLNGIYTPPSGNSVELNFDAGTVSQIALESGSYTLGINAALLSKGSVVTLESSNYSLTLSETTLTKGLKFSLSTLACAVDNSLVNVTKENKLSLSTGAYSSALSNTSFVKGIQVTLSNVDYTLSTNSISFVKVNKEVIESKNYTLSLNNLSLAKGTISSVSSSNYSLGLGGLSLSKGFTVALEAIPASLVFNTVSFPKSSRIAIATSDTSLGLSETFLSKGAKVLLSSNAFHLSLKPVGVNKGNSKSIDIETVGYSLILNDQGLLHNRKTAVDTTTYIVNGIVSLKKGFNLSLINPFYSIGLNNLSFKSEYKLPIIPANYSLDFKFGSANKGFYFNVNSNSFILNQKALGFIRGYRLTSSSLDTSVGLNNLTYIYFRLFPLLASTYSTDLKDLKFKYLPNEVDKKVVIFATSPIHEFLYQPKESKILSVSHSNKILVQSDITKIIPQPSIDKIYITKRKTWQH